jgi:predicted negative regulator of RcsB-dependent stress response
MTKKTVADQLKKDKALFEAGKQFKNTETLVGPEELQLHIDIKTIAKMVVDKHNYSDDSYGAQVRIEYNSAEIEKQIKEQVEAQVKAALKGKVDDALIQEMFNERPGGNSLYGFPNSFSKYNF